MNFFGKVFGKNSPGTKTNVLDSGVNLPVCSSEQALIELFIGIALDKQHDFYEVIGDSNWNADLDIGQIRFGENLSFPVQILGTFSHSSKTWLWIWANKKSNYPKSLTQLVHKLKAYGETHKIDLLTIDRQDMQFDDLHRIGIIASGLFNSSAYYIADYGEGAMLVSIKSDSLEQVKNDTPVRPFTVIPQMISLFDINHKLAIANYLSSIGYTLTENSCRLTATKDINHVNVEYDELDRLINLTSALN
jgi:hypothetical protein